MIPEDHDGRGIPFSSENPRPLPVHPREMKFSKFANLTGTVPHVSRFEAVKKPSLDSRAEKERGLGKRMRRRGVF